MNNKDDLLKQRIKHEQMMLWENKYVAKGFRLIAGIDEAGRGPLAGPVVAAAVILDPLRPIYGLDDSKKLTERKRENLYQQIIDQCIAYSYAKIDAQEIDKINILNATKKAMLEAVIKLQPQADFLLFDAVQPDQCPYDYLSIIKGDTKSVSIAAASILAKVTRDRIMRCYEEEFPQYGFQTHKGYGTKKHYQALLEHGPVGIHRQSFLKNLEEKRSRY